LNSATKLASLRPLLQKLPEALTATKTTAATAAAATTTGASAAT